MARRNASSTVWEEPAPASRGRGVRNDYDELKAELQENPDKWAVVKDYAYSPGGAGVPWRNQGYEIAVRKVAEGVYRLYARWPSDSGNGNGDVA